MAKKAEQKKLSDGKVSLEQNSIYDDSLLPAAEEIERLNNISSEILPWIMKRTEVEQDARIKFNEERVGLAKKDLNNTHVYNFVALIFAFLIVLMFLGFSFYLIINNQETVGSIFAGGTMVLVVSYFLKVKK